MKTFKKIFFSLAFLIALIANATLAMAQKSPTSKTIAIKNAVDSQRYIFYAQYINPLRGGQRYVTPYYTMSVSKDTIICDLPYFGRAYTAPIGTSEGGIKFTSTNFGYTIAARKKGGWDVSIKPKDGIDVQQVTMTIYDDGTTSVQVISNNRDAISYNGYITKSKK